ncbi:3-deoxy-D-manno-octulosonic acid transferase [Methylobrevis albus]|uniref:3-deoxy-D-manno-octulosonic acid transferase n=1 Tax=Methylobrevis albus TaxID=2793297 RepID=A0A931MWG9_9HYPH|nr:3-deoxy-D-manno-octulosonic acid transferase [Methylobrevis albus]MBH0236963.1 3-deoxy-D-manno-octulosonic acid transferase [Methylobrevis albus]
MQDGADHLIAAYAHATGLARPLAHGLVAVRRRRGKEHAERWRERFGEPSLPASAAPTVWVHAASVGETIAVMPLIYRIAATGLAVVLTTVTLTSAQLVAGRLPPGAVHQFVPLDVLPYVRRFLDAWNPQLAIFVESEIWPATIYELAARNVPLVVCNARMSERSFRGWQRWPRVAQAVFGRIRHCLAQSAVDGERFRALGAPRVTNVGNIKFDAVVPEAPPAAAAALKAALAGRPMLLAASTHPGEDQIVIDAFVRMRPSLPDLLLMIAPRHPVRAGEIAGLAEAAGLASQRRSTGALPQPEVPVYIADTVGELGTLYRLATVALIGGTFSPKVGGHNPIEPGKTGTAIVAGPHVKNFEQIFAALTEADAVARVRDATDLYDVAERLIRNAVIRKRQTDAAARVVASFAGSLARTQAAIDPLVDPLVVAARLASRR